MPQEVTNEELARMIAKGFSGVDKSLEVVGADVAILKQDMFEVKGKLSTVEAKLDRALYKELDVHERWIQQLAEKVGVVLVR